MAGNIIGIEVGSSTIKLIEVTKKAATLKVENFSLIKTPKDCITNGIITRMEPVYDSIAKELAAKGYKARKTVLVIQSNHIIIRNAVVDKQPEKVIKQLIAIRPEEYLPVEASQYQIDFKVVKEFEEEGVSKQEITLVAAPNNIVLPMVNLVESLKLTPLMISIPSEALVKAFGTQQRIVHDTEGSVLVIDIGGKSTTVTIISKDQSILTRMIEFGGDMINDTLNNSYTNPDESTMTEDAKKEYEEYLKELIKPQIEYNIIAELERILQFYYSRFENSPIKKVYLIGGGANIKGIKTYIRDSLNMQVKKLNEFSTVIDKPEIGFEPYRRFFVNILGAINGI